MPNQAAVVICEIIWIFEIGDPGARKLIFTPGEKHLSIIC